MSSGISTNTEYQYPLEGDRQLLIDMARCASTIPVVVVEHSELVLLKGGATHGNKIGRLRSGNLPSEEMRTGRHEATCL